MARLPRWANISHVGAKQRNGRENKYMDDNFNFEKEEYYLRQRAFRRSSDIIDGALQSSLEDTLTDLIQDVHDFFRRFLPQDDIIPSYSDRDRTECDKRSRESTIPSINEELTSKKQKVCGSIESNGSVFVDDSFAIPTFQLIHPDHFFYFPPTILPIAKVNCCFSLLDRREMVRIFSNGIQTKGRHAFVQLKENYRTGDNSRKNSKTTSHSVFLHEILYQCILQEENSTEFLHLLTLKYKNNIPYFERLVEWAGKTESFDSIIVIFENAESTSSSCLDSFIGALSALRSTYGIPISLVLFSVSSQLNEKLDSLSRCNINENVVIKDFHTKSSGYMLDIFFQHLYMDHYYHQFKLPIILGGTLLTKIREHFDDIHGSVVTAAMQIKMAISYHFCRTGSFFSLINDEEYCANNWQRLAFFCLDSSVKSNIIIMANKTFDLNSSVLVAWLKEKTDSMRMSCLVCAVIEVFQNSLPLFLESEKIGNNGNCKESNVSSFESKSIIESYLTRSFTYKKTVQKIHELLRRAPIRKLLELFSKLRCQVQSFLEETPDGSSIDWIYEHLEKMTDSSKPNETIRNLLEILNESIVLLGEIHRNSESTTLHVQKELREDIIRRITTIFETPIGMGSKNVFSKLSSLQYSSTSTKPTYYTDLFLSLRAQPRRMIAASLSEVKDPNYVIKGGGADACIILRLMENRVITTSDWLEMFINKIMEQNPQSVCDQEKLLERFVFAVYELIFCGIVIRSRTRDDSFEKCALVWTRPT